MDSTPMKMSTNELITQGKEALKEVEKLTLDTFSEVSERMLDSGKKLKSIVKENPGLSIAAGVAIGFILSQISKERK
jgi:hypothetical protein